MYLLTNQTDYVQPTRRFSLAYLIIDSICLILLLFLLIRKKKYVTLIWSLFGGILYWIVDYGYFYLLSHSREIFFTVGETTALADSLITSLVLLWMSLSYGILDFAFIWLWLSKDEDRKEFTWLIVTFWCTIPLTSTIFDNSIPNMIYFTTTRSTGKYHGIMALIMLVGYLILIIDNLRKKPEERADIKTIFLIGFMSQFLWEFFLLVFNIRSTIYQDDFRRQMLTLLQDSLIETNLGLPYMYFINKAVMGKYNENLTKKSKPAS